MNTFHGDCVSEICGIDEAYIDVSDEVNWRIQNAEKHSLFGKQCVGTKVSLLPQNQDVHLNIASQIAHEIRNEIFHTHGFTLSAGISHSKFLSKLASKKKKPNGQATIYSESFNSEVNHLDISVIPNIGYQTRTNIVQRCNIETVEQLRDLSFMTIRKCFNSDKLTSRVLNIANGRYDEEYDKVVSRGPVKSIGSELTFLPVQTYEDVALKLSIITQDLAARIQRDIQRNNKRYATNLTLKYCHGGYSEKFHSKSCKIDSNCYYTSANSMKIGNDETIQDEALILFKQNVSLPFKLQRLQVSVSDFQQVMGNAASSSSNTSSSQKRKLGQINPSNSKQKSIVGFLAKKTKQ